MKVNVSAHISEELSQKLKDLGWEEKYNIKDVINDRQL